MFALLLAALVVIGLLFPKLRGLVAALLIVVAIAMSVGLLSITLPAFTWGGLTFGGMTLAGATHALLIGGMSFLLFPDESAAVVEKIGEVAGKAAGAVGSAAGSVIAGIASSPIGLFAIGVAAFLFFGKKRDQRRDGVVKLGVSKPARDEEVIDADYVPT